MTDEEQKEYDKLDKKAQAIYDYFGGFLTRISLKKLNELVDIEIEMEKFCNQ